MNSNAHFEHVRHKYLIKLISWVAVYILVRARIWVDCSKCFILSSWKVSVPFLGRIIRPRQNARPVDVVVDFNSR